MVNHRASRSCFDPLLGRQRGRCWCLWFCSRQRLHSAECIERRSAQDPLRARSGPAAGASFLRQFGYLMLGPTAKEERIGNSRDSILTAYATRISAPIQPGLEYCVRGIPRTTPSLRPTDRTAPSAQKTRAPASVSGKPAPKGGWTWAFPIKPEGSQFTTKGSVPRGVKKVRKYPTVNPRHQFWSRSPHTASIEP